MIFFAIMCFICLPVVAVMLVDVKKTNAMAQTALYETKKLEAKLKPKENEDE
jgi:CHASE3 domain sensor protein